MTPVEKARYIIEHNEDMVIASADTSGKPWVSPVFFMYDSHYNFYWVSNKEALHSQNVRNRPEIAIVIFGELPSGDMDGVYIDASATELLDETEINAAIKVLAKRPQPTKWTTKSVGDVTAKAAWRIYRATPVAVFKRADATVNGQAITVREPIEL